MTFRTESEIVQASNASQDLANLVRAYFNIHRKYAQGLGGVTVPDEPYEVVFMPMNKEGMLRVKLVYSKTTSHQSPVYYDVDDDNFSESWGSSNISHYHTTYTTGTGELGFNIPFKLLLQSRENIELSVKKFAEEERKRLQEVERQSKIAAHQEAIRKLQEQQ
jgi:hypothetical protein